MENMDGIFDGQVQQIPAQWHSNTCEAIPPPQPLIVSTCDAGNIWDSLVPKSLKPNLSE